MSMLIAGLLLFLGVHSTRIFADGWRTRQIARLGPWPWKGLYSLASAIGFVLIVWGYSMARNEPGVLWTPSVWMRHAAILLTVPAFILIAAAYVPGSHMKSMIGHPMIAGVKAWAFAHLLANGTLASVVLFGAFLVWAVADFAASRRRDRRNGTVYPPVSLARDAIATVIGLAAWTAFAFLAHGWLIGVRPLG